MTRTIVIDLDETIAMKSDTGRYEDCMPNLELIRKLREYKQKGFKICVFTARNMRKYQGDLNKINLHTLPLINSWLEKHNVPADEVLIGKPWCGVDGFYVDDRAIRPNEFVELSYLEISNILDSQ